MSPRLVPVFLYTMLHYGPGGGTTTVVPDEGCVGGYTTVVSPAVGFLAFASTALDVTYEPPLIPNSARMPPGIVGNAGGFRLTIIRNRPSPITNVKMRN